MRTLQLTRYAAFDGREFESAAECRAYEREHAERRLVGLTAEQVTAAVAWTDAELAEAIETVGDRIRRARLEAGNLKRRRSVTAPAEPVEFLDADQQTEGTTQ